jgi:hypothetical protein
MVEIEQPINLACKHKKNNLLNVITYRCLWKNQRNSAQISDKQCSLVLIYKTITNSQYNTIEETTLG